MVRNITENETIKRNNNNNNGRNVPKERPKSTKSYRAPTSPNDTLTRGAKVKSRDDDGGMDKETTFVNANGSYKCSQAEFPYHSLFPSPLFLLYYDCWPLQNSNQPSAPFT